MPYDANGNWVPESASVSERVTGLIQQGSTFTERAKADANIEANRRGLRNSSIAIQAGEEAAQKAALPIAAQEATQIQQQNLQLQGEQQQTQEAIAERAFRASESGLERAFRGSESQATRDFTTGENVLDRAARQGLLETELTSREGISAADRDQAQLLQAGQIFSTEKLAGLDNQTRIAITNLNTSSQQAIADLNIAAAERQKATEAAVQYAAQYELAFRAIHQNKDLPASYRDAAIKHIGDLRSSNFDLITQVHNVPLTWSSGSALSLPEPPPTPGSGSYNYVDGGPGDVASSGNSYPVGTGPDPSAAAGTVVRPNG